MMLFAADPAAVMPTLLEAFTKLSKRLRGLSDLPLKVVSVQALSAGTQIPFSSLGMLFSCGDWLLRFACLRLVQGYSWTGGID